MGASCVGKRQHPEPRKPDNNSNTISSEAPSSEEAVLQTKPIPLPAITLHPHRPLTCPIPSSFRIPPERLSFHKEYRYQQLFEFRTENRFASSCSIGELAEKRQEAARAEEWLQCSSLERDLHDPSTVALLNGSTYIKRLLPQQPQQNLNKMGQLGEAEIVIRVDMQPHPTRLLLLNMDIDEDEVFTLHQKCYPVNHYEEIQIISKEILETHPIYEYFRTPFLNGVVFSHKNQMSERAQSNFLNQIFHTKQKITWKSVLMLYINDIDHIPRHPQQGYKGILTKYFQISSIVKGHYGDIWHSSLRQLQKVVQQLKLNAFLAIQFLRCIVDCLERQYLSSGRYIDKREELNESRAKIIHQFLVLDQNTIKLINFMANTFLIFQQASEQQRQKRVKGIIRAIACELPTISDGLFMEWGYEINQKQHYFKLESYYFIKFANTPNKKQIRHIYKNYTYPHPRIINRIKRYLLEICSQENLTQQHLEAICTDFKRELQDHHSDVMIDRINILYVEDFLMRLKLLHFYLSILDGKLVEQEWKEIQDHVSTLQLVTPETILFFFTLGGLASTTLKPNIERTQAEEFYYLKALQLAHKMYGDPRCNRSCMPIEQEQAWQLVILQNYSSLFKGSFQKREFHYLNNIYECLKEDFKSQNIQEESSQKKIAKMMQSLPIKTMSGHFYLRPMVFDAENEEVRSNYSESLSSSSSSKRTNRASYKINESQFSLKLSMHCGIIRWGHNIAGPPHILPPFKNKQVIAISSGNYHTIFLMESGVYGWGENHSFQLGAHNKEKVYLKETVCVQAMPINRNRDSFQINCGNQHSAVLINGILYMWGQSEGGILAGNGHTFDMISCGGLHTLAIRERVVYSWGRGEGGQLGHPLAALNQKKKEETTQFFIDVPTPINPIPPCAIKVACGDAHSLVLTSEGKVYVFGFCYQGQLGLGLTGDNETFQVFEPQQHGFFKERVIDIFAGPTFSFFKTEKEEVFSCGMNDCLQLGIDRALKVFQKKKYLNRTTELNRRKVGEQQFSKPRQINMFSGQFGVKLLQLECGENHCLALVKYMGQEVMLMGWGLNRHFQIESSLPETTTPRTLEAFYSLDITHICCGSTFSLASIGKLVVTKEQLERELSDAMATACRL